MGELLEACQVIRQRPASSGFFLFRRLDGQRSANDTLVAAVPGVRAESFEQDWQRLARERQELLLGSSHLMRERRADADALARVADQPEGRGRAVSWPLRETGQTTVLPGLLAFGDAIKASARSAVARRHGQNVDTVMPTADKRGSADAVARAIGIGQFRAEVHTLRVIRQARDLGFSIHEIGELLATKRTLEHLVHCCHGDERPECPILETLAGSGVLQVPHAVKDGTRGQPAPRARKPAAPWPAPVTLSSTPRLFAWPPRRRAPQDLGATAGQRTELK